MNEFERDLTDHLLRRADNTQVSLDLDAIKSLQAPATSSRSSRRSHGARPRARTSMALVASTIVVVGGLFALTESRSSVAPVAGSIPNGSTGAGSSLKPYGNLPVEGPTIADHWHTAYGIDLCGSWLQLEGNLEDIGPDGQLTNQDFAETGIHSHDDGLIHLHPFGSAGEGTNATLGRFLANYGIELTDNGLEFTAATGNETLRTAYDHCADSTLEPVVVVWPDRSNPDEKVIVDQQVSGVPLGADDMVITLAFTDDANSIEMPPWATILDHDDEAESATLGAPTTVDDGILWPETRRHFASAVDVATAFALEKLGWTSANLEVRTLTDLAAEPVCPAGVITTDRSCDQTSASEAMQSFTMTDLSTGTSIEGSAVPSPAGWGIVQIGLGQMSSLTANDERPVAVNFDLDEAAATTTLDVRLIDGTTITERGVTEGSFNLPAEFEFSDLMSVLVIGFDEQGRAVSAEAGMFSFGTNDALVALTSAPAAESG